MSIGVDSVFNISDLHPIAFPTCDCRQSCTDCPRYSTLRTYMYLIYRRVLETYVPFFFRTHLRAP